MVSRRWFIAGLGIGQICSWGTLYYSFPLLAVAMSADLGWPKAQLYGAATAGLLLAAVLAYPVGVAIDRGYGRSIMVGASLLAAIVLMAWSRTQNYWVFCGLATIAGGLQAATLYEPAFAVVARRAGAGNSREDITALTLWGGFASTVFVPLTQWVIEGLGWRDALMILGLVNLIVCAGVYQLVIRPANDLQSGNPAIDEAKRSGAVRAAMGTPVFWTLMIALVAFSAAFAGFLFHLYPLLIERQFVPHDVVLAMALIGPAQVGGRIAIIVLAPRLPMRILGSVMAVILTVSFIALALIPPTFLAAACVLVLYGASNGIMTIVRGVMVPEMVSRTDYGAINGALAVPATVARAFAPLAAAMLWTTTGSYDVVLKAIVGCSVLFTAAFWVSAALSRPAMPQEADSALIDR